MQLSSLNRRRTESETGQQQSSIPPLPTAIQHQSQLRSRIRPFPGERRTSSRVEQQQQQQQQQVPASTQPAPEPTTSAELRAYEQNIEEDFKIQIQPILQNYLNKTKRLPPINLFLDMSPIIQY